MKDLFLTVLELALSGTWMLLAVLLARLLLKKAPRRWVLLLWALAALRLALPFSIESRTSLVPEAEPAQIVSAIQEPAVTETPSTAENIRFSPRADSHRWSSRPRPAVW